MFEVKYSCCIESQPFGDVSFQSPARMAEANVESSAPPPEDGPGEGGKEETKEEQEGDRAFEVGDSGR